MVVKVEGRGETCQGSERMGRMGIERGGRGNLKPRVLCREEPRFRVGGGVRRGRFGIAANTARESSNNDEDNDDGGANTSRLKGLDPTSKK